MAGAVFGFSSSLSRCFRCSFLFLSFAFLMLFTVDSWAGVGGSVSGTVRDSSSAVVPKASVTATNIDNGIQKQAATNDRGFYSFPDLPIGRYNITIQRTGFKPYRRTGIIIDANSALTVDAVLEVGERSDVVTVVENQLHVETTSTQMGEVITGAQMTARASQWPELYGFAFSSARGCAGHFDHVRHGAGRGSKRALSLRRFESRHHLDQRPAGICQQFSRERKRCRRGRQHGGGDYSQPRFH